MTRSNYSVSIPGSVSYSETDSVFPGNNYSWSSVAPACEHSDETVSGTSRRKPKGWIPPTGYSLLHRSYRLASGQMLLTIRIQNAPDNFRTVVKRWSGFVGEGTTGSFNTLGLFDALCPENFIPSGLANSSLIRARLKIKNSKVNLGNAFGERAQLAHQLGDTATRLARSVRQLRKGHWADALRTLGIKSEKGKPRGSNWTSHWLALQYGWKPLLSDIYGAMDALSRRPKSDWKVTAKGSVSAKDTFTAKYTGSIVGSGTATVSSRAFTRIDCLPQNEAIISLASLGILNPLEVAWEVTYASFVVDWIYPVGDWLDSLDAMLGYSDAYTSTSLFQEMKWSVNGGYQVLQQGPPVWQTQANSYGGSKRVVKLNRSASSGVPMPTLPSFKDGRSLGHMANGLALLAQAFGRTPRPLKNGLPRNFGPPIILRKGEF